MGTTIRKYIKKPILIEACEWNGSNVEELIDWIGVKCEFDDNLLYIDTLEGKMRASIGDFIIKGISGEFYPCKPDIFWRTYDLVGRNE